MTTSAAAGPTVPGTEPYPWPFDGLRADALALLLVGWDTHWAGRVSESQPAVIAAEALATVVRRLGGPVLAVSHVRPARAPADAADPVPLQTPVVDASVTAAGLDGFYGSHLGHHLRAVGRHQLLVAGHGLEGPVHSTLRAANDRGFECLLVLDACSSLAPDLVPAASSTVQMSGGIFGAVGHLDDVLTTLASLQTPASPSSSPLTQEVQQ